MAVETRPRDKEPGLIGGALRMAEAGPRPFYRAALASLAVTSLGAMAIASSVHHGAGLRGPQRDMILAGLAAFCCSALLGIGSLVGGRFRSAQLDRFADPQTRSAIWLALAAWFPCLLIVVYYRARATFPPSVQWINFGFTDKRWETAAYLLGALAPVLFLTAAAQVLRAARDRPPSWRAWLAGLVTRASGDLTTDAVTPAGAHDRTDGSRPRWRRALVVSAGIATALALAWYFLGPPWHVSQTPTSISDQEDIFLGGFQAIASGHLPYVGVAGNQYGPGTQLACYWLMRHVTSFSVVGFRQAWSVLQWAGASVLFLVFFLAFGYVRGLVISLLSVLVYPTALRQFAFRPSGYFDGYWAWANPLRYAGAVALVILLPAVIRRCPSWRGVAGAAALGLGWGVTSYMAQENLAGGVVGALALGALLLFTGTFGVRAVASALAAVAAGFVAVWLPVLGFYAAHGDLGSFLHLYYLVPSAVAEGYSNTTWQGASHQASPLTTIFHVLPFLLAVIALASVFEAWPLRIATRWSRERMLLAGSVLATILLYEGAMLRADASHLAGTLLVVPALVVAVATILPRLLGGRRRATLMSTAAALAAASIALLPSAYSWLGVRSAADAPYLDRQHLAAEPRVGQPVSPAALRIGGGLAQASDCCQLVNLSMPGFIAKMNRLHAIIGDRVTYVADVPDGYPGLVYFVADLIPAPVQYDKYTTVVNVPQLRAYMTYFRTHVVAHTQALVTTSLDAPEARYFLQRYPGARRINLGLAGAPYYVLLAPGTGRR